MSDTPNCPAKPVMPRAVVLARLDEILDEIMDEVDRLYEPSVLIDPYAEKRRKQWLNDVYGEDRKRSR
jgi:hypothetical protein